ncbi:MULTISPECIES: hypothetical protein [unclassified Mesorhizobium]|uniref:SecDF P1 head subdomain-containing protein n=1 Tax=unclassified Mesorhizobium TaxID=325217 RepID=UPI0012DD0A59|nr:hypothetical protein [Mesorhizobium sp. L2C084A000]
MPDGGRHLPPSSRFRIVLICVAAVITAVLDVSILFAASPLAKQPYWAPKIQTAIGLDQKGISRFVFGLDLDELIKGRLETTQDEIRSLLRSAHIGYTGLAVSGRAVQVHISDAAQLVLAKVTLKTLTDPSADDDAVQELVLDESGPVLLKFVITGAGIKYLTSAALKQSVEVIKHRIHDFRRVESGISEPIVRQQGDDRIMVQVSGLKDSHRLSNILVRAAKLTVQMIDGSMPVKDALNGPLPNSSSMLYSHDDPPVPYLIENRVIVSDDNLINAKPAYSPQSNKPIVLFRVDSKGTARLSRETSQNVGSSFAVVLDGRVVSVPVIREPILDGIGQISGNFTVEDANDLAVLLRNGRLPARLTIVEESPMAAPK